MAIEIRQRIWYDLFHCKNNELYMVHYLAYSKDCQRRYKAVVVILAVIGTMSGQLIEWIGWVTCALILISQTMESLQKLLTKDDDEILRMGEYKMLYIEHFNNLDRLWSDLDDEDITSSVAKTRYFDLREKYLEIEKMDNTFRIGTKKKVQKKAEELARQYMNEHYIPITNYNHEQDQQT